MRNIVYVLTLAIATIVLALVPDVAIAQVNVLLAGLRTDKTVVVLEGGQERATQPTGSSPTVAVDATKNYVVYEGDCSYVVVEEGSSEQRRCDDETDSNVRQPGDDCRRCRRLAGYITRGAFRLAVSAPSSQQSGLNPSVFGYVGFSSTSVSNADEAEGVIETRFRNANYNPNTVINVDTSGRGVAFGGGVDLGFGGSPVGIRVAVNHTPNQTVPTQEVSGERTLNGLRFNQEGETSLRSTGLSVGLRYAFGRLAVAAGPQWNWWTAEHHQTARLQVLCPNACVTANTDDTRTTTSGTSPGFQASVEAAIFREALSIYASYSRATYDDAYTPTDPLAYPTNWSHYAVIIGTMVRF